MNLPHINIGTNTEGNLYVEVEDTELFDYVDDYLTEECSIEYEHVIQTENNGIPVYTMLFSKETNSIVLETILNNISVVEIEKIYKSNNN
jgi:hypothetical protein